MKFDLLNSNQIESIENILDGVFLTNLIIAESSDILHLETHIDDSFKELISSNFFTAQTAERKSQYATSYNKLKSLLKLVDSMNKFYLEGFNNT